MGERRHPTSRLRFYTTVIVAGVVFFTLVSSPFVIPVVNDVTAEPLVCTVESAEVVSSSGGPRSATKHEVVHVQSPDCGEMRFYRLWGGLTSFQDLADQLDERQGQRLTFWVGKLQVNVNSTEANRVDL